MTPRDLNVLLPLRPVVFQVLLSLADGERHGYAIVQDIAERSSARMQLEPGNLYRTLRLMLEEGLIEESDRYTRFPSMPDRPLQHLSVCRINNLLSLATHDSLRL